MRKALEAYFTVLIEAMWPKERILEMYLNIAEFGHGVYGVEAATQRFYHKPAARLTSSEAATLAAVLPNPRETTRRQTIPPTSNPGADWILGQMRGLGGASYLKALESENPAPRKARSAR